MVDWKNYHESDLLIWPDLTLSAHLAVILRRFSVCRTDVPSGEIHTPIIREAWEEGSLSFVSFWLFVVTVRSESLFPSLHLPEESQINSNRYYFFSLSEFASRRLACSQEDVNYFLVQFEEILGWGIWVWRHFYDCRVIYKAISHWRDTVSRYAKLGDWSMARLSEAVEYGIAKNLLNFRSRDIALY